MIRHLLVYVWVLIVVGNVGLAQSQKNKGIWRVVIVAATGEAGIQEGAEAFVQYTKAEVENMAAALQMELEVVVIKDKDLYPAMLQNTLKQLQQPLQTTGKTMLTWISFTHGFNTENTTSKLPYLIAHPTKTILSAQEMRYAFSLEEVYSKLLNSGVYDHVHVWAELCNHICRGCQQMPTEGLVGLGNSNASALATLLFSVKGEVMVSSAYGQASCSTVVGGPFSRGLFEALSMVQMGDAQTPLTFEGKDGFFKLVQHLSQTYAKQLPGAVCQEQQPQGYVGSVK